MLISALRHLGESHMLMDPREPQLTQMALDPTISLSQTSQHIPLQTFLMSTLFHERVKTLTNALDWSFAGSQPSNNNNEHQPQSYFV